MSYSHVKHEEKTYLDARKFTNTVQLLLSANKASLWIDVLGGRTPFANLEIIVRGRERSCDGCNQQFPPNFQTSHDDTSTLDPSRTWRPAGAGDSSSPFVTVERFDFLPGMVAIPRCVVAKPSKIRY